MTSRSQVLALSCSLLAGAWADQVITLEGDLLEGQVQKISSNEGLALEGQDSWPLERLRAIIPAHQAEDVMAAPYTVWLTNGSRFSTRVLKLSDESYQIENPVLGTLVVPIDLVWAVRLSQADPDSRFARAVRSYAELGEDTIYVTGTGTTELQEVHGLIEELDEKGLTFDQDGEVKVLPAQQVHGALLASPPFAPEADEPWITARLTLSDGSLISGNIAKLIDGNVSMQLGEGMTIDLPWAQVRRLTIESDLLHYLSDLEPTEATTEAIYALPRTWKRDLNVRGSALRLGQNRFEKGIGAASGTTLTFANDAQYTLFTATIGIDAQSVEGDCAFVIRAGKEELLRENLRSSDPAKFVKLDIEDFKELTLTVEPANGGIDLNDDANWAEACFLQLD